MDIRTIETRQEHLKSIYRRESLARHTVRIVDDMGPLLCDESTAPCPLQHLSCDRSKGLDLFFGVNNLYDNRQVLGEPSSSGYLQQQWRRTVT
jgi:hypothetical protein